SCHFSCLRGSLFFFFQAEDGIRDFHVTGVQTCALPIWPKLYLHGLSLGAVNSERSFHLFELLEHPFDGAVWSGPPFGATQWAALTRARNPGTPVWRPRFQDGSFVRFMNQHGSSDPPGTPWGPMRIVY